MSARVVLTYDDYAALPDDGSRYELYEGELIMMPSPQPRHQTSSISSASGSGSSPSEPSKVRRRWSSRFSRHRLTRGTAE